MHMISVEPTLEGPPSLSGQYSKMHLAACRQTAENRASRPVLPLQPADARACIAEGLRVETKLKDSVDGRHCCCHCSRGKTLSQPPELTETLEPKFYRSCRRRCWRPGLGRQRSSSLAALCEDLGQDRADAHHGDAHANGPGNGSVADPTHNFAWHSIPFD